jgi:hypothetical protein
MLEKIAALDDVREARRQADPLLAERAQAARAAGGTPVGSTLEADDHPEESADRYEDNARGKARYGRAVAPADVWVVGEDAGIEVEALGWGPGPRSARWSDRPLEDVLASGSGGRARYRCTMVAIAPDGREVVADGTLDGSIADGARGDRGSATTRSSSRTARLAPSPSSATSGSRATRPAPARRPRTEALL